MDKSTSYQALTENIVNVLAVMFGVFLILTHKWQARAYANYQKKLFGLQFSSREIRLAEFLSIAVGAIFILIGILSWFNVIPAHP